MSENLKTNFAKGLASLFIVASFTGYSQEKKPVLSGKERIKMFSKQKELAESSPYKDNHWQYIGPTNISGRCTDVEAISPRGNQYTIWVGSATGGVMEIGK